MSFLLLNSIFLFAFAMVVTVYIDVVKDASGIEIKSAYVKKCVKIFFIIKKPPNFKLKNNFKLFATLIRTLIRTIMHILYCYKKFVNI